MKAGELLIELGLKWDKLKFNDFISAVGDLNMSSIMTTLGLGAMYAAITKIMNTADTTAVKLNTFSKETGLSQTKMYQWSQAAEQMGVEGDAVASSLKTIQSRLAGLKMGTDTGLITPFAILNKVGAGITGKESPFELITKTALAIHRLEPEVRRMVMAQMGLDDSMLVLMADWKRFNQIAETTPIVTEEQIQKMMKFHEVNKRLGQDFKDLWVDIATIIEPVLETIEKILAVFMELAGMRHNYNLGDAFLGPGLKSALVAGNQGAFSMMDNLGEMMANLSMGKFAAAGQVSNNRNMQVTNNFNITGRDPEEIAQKVQDAWHRMHSDAEYQGGKSY